MNKKEVTKELTRLGWTEGVGGIPSRNGSGMRFKDLVELCKYFSMERRSADSSVDFAALAEALRKLWPSGEKDGKYPWRDTVPNLEKRLRLIWDYDNLDDKYTADDCLKAARRYLAQFQDNTKYMQTLRYFIFKQNKSVGRDGRITYTYKSSLVDMLDGNAVIGCQEEWAEALADVASFNQGELV